MKYICRVIINLFILPSMIVFFIAACGFHASASVYRWAYDKPCPIDDEIERAIIWQAIGKIKNTFK